MAKIHRNAAEYFPCSSKKISKNKTRAGPPNTAARPIISASFKYDERSTRYEWIPVFRYAEILLNLAECYYNIGNESQAIECLKQVRTRSIAEDQDPLVTYEETGDALWTVIDNERRWEFMAEGIRGYDISRRAEDYRHPLTDGSWSVVATPSDKTSYCWSFPLYETTVNTALSN